jgi:hypothetical protein
MSAILTGVDMVTTTSSSRVKISGDVLFQELQGDAVLLDMKTGVYFGLDRVGTRIWQLLAEISLISDVVDKMVEEFDVPTQRCSSDVLDLVERLREQGLLAIE